MKVFVICRDRVTYLKDVLAWVDHMDVTLIDLDSTYEPLLEFYRETNHNVIFTHHNLGQRIPWLLSLVPQFEEYIVTDPDVVPVETCPSDWLDVMRTVLYDRGQVERRMERYPEDDPATLITQKVGFGLKIDDIPDHYIMKPQVLDWEGKLWGDRYDVAGYEAHEVPIDTTFALYRPGAWIPGGDGGANDIWPAFRLGEPYVARHLPWYTDSQNPTEEDIFYKARASPYVANWTYDGASKNHGG